MIKLTDKQGLLSQFKRDQLNKSLTMFQWDGLPDTLPSVELEKFLQINGYAIIAKVDDNLYAFEGGFSGKDPYNRPTKAIVNNPALNNHDEFTIGEDCVVIYNDDMKQGLRKIYEFYGQRLIENHITMLMTDYNLRMPFTISSNDDTTTQSAKEYLRKIIDGSLGVIGEARLFKSLNVTPTNSKQVSSFADLYGYQQFILAQLNNTIGLATNNNMKRERLTTNEIEVNKNASYPLVDNMLRNRQTAVDAINAMFGTEISVTFNSIWAGVNNDDNDVNSASVNNSLEDTSNDISINSDDSNSINDDERSNMNEPVNSADDDISDDKSLIGSNEQSKENTQSDNQDEPSNTEEPSPSDNETDTEQEKEVDEKKKGEK